MFVGIVTGGASTETVASTFSVTVETTVLCSVRTSQLTLHKRSNDTASKGTTNNSLDRNCRGGRFEDGHGGRSGRREKAAAGPADALIVG